MCATRDRKLWLPLRAPLNYTILSADEAMLARRRAGVREVCPELDAETALLDVLRTADGVIVGFRLLRHAAAASVLEFVEPSAALSATSDGVLIVRWRDGELDETSSFDGLLVGAWFLIDSEHGLVVLLREATFRDLRFEQLFE